MRPAWHFNIRRRKRRVGRRVVRAITRTSSDWESASTEGAVRWSRVFPSARDDGVISACSDSGHAPPYSRKRLALLWRCMIQWWSIIQKRSHSRRAQLRYAPPQGPFVKRGSQILRADTLARIFAPGYLDDQASIGLRRRAGLGNAYHRDRWRLDPGRARACQGRRRTQPRGCAHQASAAGYLNGIP